MPPSPTDAPGPPVIPDLRLPRANCQPDPRRYHRAASALDPHAEAGPSLFKRALAPSRTLPLHAAAILALARTPAQLRPAARRAAAASLPRHNPILQDLRIGSASAPRAAPSLCSASPATPSPGFCSDLAVAGKTDLEKFASPAISFASLTPRPSSQRHHASRPAAPTPGGSPQRAVRGHHAIAAAGVRRRPPALQPRPPRPPGELLPDPSCFCASSRSQGAP